MKSNFSILIVVLLSFFSNSLLSQSEEIQILLDESDQAIRLKSRADSIAKLAYKMAVEKQEFNGQIAALRKLGWIAEYHYYRDSALVYYEKALGLSQQNNEKSFEWKLYLQMASIKESLGQRDTAILMANHSLKAATEIMDSSGMADAYHTLAFFYSHEGIHEKSIAYYLKSLEIFENIHDQAKIADVSQGIGVIYNKQRDYEKAELYFKKALNMNNELKDTARAIAVLNDFGILNKNKGNYIESEKYYLKMLELSMIHKFAWVKPYAFNNLGNLYFHMKKYQKGVEYSQKGVEYNRISGNKSAESDGLTQLAKNQLALNQIKEAKQNLERSVMLARDVHVLEKERDALLILSEVYEKTGNFALALSHFKEHKVLYDSIYNMSKTEQIHGLEKKYQAEKKDKEITLLTKNSELQTVKTTMLWTGLGLSLFFGGLLIWFQMQKRKKEKQIEKEKLKVIYLENQRLSQELSFKKQELTSKVLQLCRKNEFLHSLDKKVIDIKSKLQGTEKSEFDKLSRQINRDMQADNDWVQFLKSFESVHPDFNTQVSKNYPNFSKGELRMACLLKMNLSTKDIANLLNITIAGVKKTRNRMRKKMTIDSSINLTSFFIALDI